MKHTLLKNCQLLNNTQKVNILLKDDKIANISEYEILISKKETIDIQGKLIIPGFIDLHVHGAGGAEVFKGDLQQLHTMASTLLKYGITGITPASIVNPDNDYAQLRMLNQSLNNYDGKVKMHGLHLEGPFINPIKRGGIPISSVRDYNRDELLKIIKILGNNLKMLTIAPEISPNMEIIEILLDNNIIPALGHTNITYKEAHKAFDKGIKHVTHVCNAMPYLHHRNPGPLLAILERKDISVQIIADGAHLDPAIVNFLYNSIGIENSICISDGQSVIGLPNGKYNINGDYYYKKGNRATDANGNLIGTALDVGSIAQKFYKFTNCSFSEAIQTVTMNPAKILGIDNLYGTIKIGKKADFVIMDDDWNVNMVFVDGKLVTT